MKRLAPDISLPPYIFIPGVNPHPKKASGHMEGEKDPIVPPIDPSYPDKNHTLRYALDLYNHGYYWESHVYFEALWNAHHRQGSVADFLKAMIKLGAAGVKINIDQKAAAAGHFERAKELFISVKETEGPKFLGFDLDQIISRIDHECFSIFPDWE